MTERVKRVFVGIPAGEGLQESVAAFKAGHSGLKVRWMRPEKLHLTMVPPWLCADCDSVCRVLQEVAGNFAPVPVRFDRVSFGPDRRSPRLIWATGRAPDTLAALHRVLSPLSGEAAFSGRGYLMHLTIARNGRQADGVFRGDGEASSWPVEWDALLDTLVLYESILKPEGAEYRVLCRSGLCGVGVGPVTGETGV